MQFATRAVKPFCIPTLLHFNSHLSLRGHRQTHKVDGRILQYTNQEAATDATTNAATDAADAAVAGDGPPMCVGPVWWLISNAAFGAVRRHHHHHAAAHNHVMLVQQALRRPCKADLPYR